jgi:hypothetical protein
MAPKRRLHPMPFCWLFMAISAGAECSLMSVPWPLRRINMLARIRRPAECAGIDTPRRFCGLVMCSHTLLPRTVRTGIAMSAETRNASNAKAVTPPDFLPPYQKAFLEFGTRALWNKRFLDAPGKEDALVIARALRIEGDREARRLAEQIEQACRAADLREHFGRIVGTSPLAYRCAFSGRDDCRRKW